MIKISVNIENLCVSRGHRSIGNKRNWEKQKLGKKEIWKKKNFLGKRKSGGKGKEQKLGGWEIEKMEVWKRKFGKTEITVKWKLGRGEIRKMTKGIFCKKKVV